MSRLVYLDFLRQVTPLRESCKKLRPDFIIFGGFDALRVDRTAQTILEMKQKHEEGHENIDAIYDRQPMFLYELELSDSTDKVFDTTGEYADLPLVVSILQIDKQKYAKSKKAPSSDLIAHFNNLVGSCVEDEKKKEGDFRIEWAVFWNLGESDVVIVFRSQYLHPIASILHKIRITKNEKYQVFSTCSHCGFPRQEDSPKTRKELTKWLSREKKVHKTGFISFINTSSAFHKLDKIFDKPSGIQGAFLFGEWDYSSYWRFDKKSEVDSMANQILLSAFSQEEPPFKTSYTLPAVKLDNLGSTDGQPLRESEEWIEKIKERFDAFIGYLVGLKIPGVSGIDDDIRIISKKNEKLLKSMSHTFTGLGKFLVRLYYGRYEQDLYTYGKPVFEALPKVIDNYKNEITDIWKNTKLTSNRKVRIISRLVIEIVDDCTQLISSMQHLFAVLSVSPHTFMETYGSNMRSLTAADKLVDAYQGLISYLCDKFPDIIRKNEGEELQGMHHVIIIPHRQSYPLHTLFFKSASPELRISQIEMDFPRMFDIRASVYVVLHECAHHLGNRMRTERYESYYRACAYLAAESVLGKYLYEPISSFVSTTSKSRLNEIDTPLFCGLQETDREEIIASCKQKVTERASIAIDALAADFEKVLRKVESLTDGKGAKGITVQQELMPDYGELFREQHYSMYILAYMQSLLKSIFPDTENGLPEKMKKVFLPTIQKHFTKGMAEIAERTAEEISIKGGNAYEASRLITKYRTGHMTEVLMYHLPARILQKIQENAFNDLLDIFTEVYADIFAVQVLNMKAFTDYCEMIHLFTGTAVYKAVMRSTNILRIATIGKVCFKLSLDRGGEEVLQQIITANKIPIWQHDELRKAWHNAMKARYLDEIIDYAEKCKNAINDQVRIYTRGKKQELNALRNVFTKDELINEIIFIETFWKHLLEGHA